jgi:superoxide reductase
MTKRTEVYECGVCGNIVEVMHASGGTLVCCGQPMTRLVERTADQGKEKHVPVVERTPKGLKVSVGSVPHPMEEKHLIEWVEVLTDAGALVAYLRPGQPPEAEFCTAARVTEVREHCTVHGLWSVRG